MKANNNIFEESWWLDTVAPGAWSESVYKDKDGIIQGRIAYVHSKKEVYMPKFTQTLGIWLSDEIKKDYGKQKEACNTLFEQINGFRSIDIHLAPENTYVLPFRWMGYQIEPRFTYRLNDIKDCNSLYNSFNKTAKKNIKSARNKVSINYNTDKDVLLNLLDKTFEAQNRRNPFDREIIKKIVEETEKRGCGQYLDARDGDGNIHSCGYFVYDERVFYYLFGATDSQYRSSGAQSLIIWEAIQLASKKSQAFDFEGSMIEGIENFFRQFSGECMPYYEIRKNGIWKDIGLLAKPKIKKILGYKI